MVKGSRCNDRRAVVDGSAEITNSYQDRHSAGEAARKILYYSVSQLLYPATVFVWYK